MRLRPRKRVTIEGTAKPDRRTLLACHVRDKGDDAPHICNICLSHMHATAERAPNWTRATCCGEVWHEACIHRYAHNADSITHTFRCPQCKQEHNVDDLDDWDAAVVIERLFPEDDYTPNDVSSSSDASAFEEESVSSDDDESFSDDEPADPPTRRTRSNPGDHDDCGRLTRSKTGSF